MPAKKKNKRAEIQRAEIRAAAAAAIKDSRKAAGIGVFKFAESLDANTQTVYNMEAGREVSGSILLSAILALGTVTFSEKFNKILQESQKLTPNERTALFFQTI